MLYYRADYRYFAISAILSSGLKEWFWLSLSDEHRLVFN